jgi:hypothetical protein
MSKTFEDVAQASDQELVQACTAISLCFVIPMPDEDVAAVQEIHTEWQETAALSSASRNQLIAILHRLLAPAAN